MSTIVSNPSGDEIVREPIPQDLHHGICVWVYDTGTHWKEPPKGYSGTAKWTPQVLIVWELPEIRIEFEDKETGEQKNLPRVISQEFTASLHEKAKLRHWLQSWRNKEFSEVELEGFELGRLLGVNCTLQVIHKTVGDKVYANIANVLPLMDKSKQKDPENDLRHFTLDSESWMIPDGTPDWIRDKIIASKEWQEQADPSLPQEPDPEYGSDEPPPVDDDDIPF